MTDEVYRERLAAIERHGSHEIDRLSTVSARSRPSAGESNVIHDVVAAMAMQERNAQAIDVAIAVATYLAECLDADYYSMHRYPPPDERCKRELARWDIAWAAGRPAP